MSKNTKGRTVKAENAYEVYRRGDWEWRVLKHYASPETEARDPYARVFCQVTSPMTYPSYDLGDVYLREITEYARLVEQPAGTPVGRAA